MSPEAPNEEQVVRGVVKRVTFRNPQNGYSVLKLSVPDSREQLTVVGTSLDTREGSNVIVRGVFKEHPKFGRQLTASSITETAPTTDDGLVKYLSSGFIKGIGEKTAERIVAEFGKDTIEVIHRDPARLAHVIGTKKAALLQQAFSDQQDVREIMQFLLEHHISPRLASRIYERYKNKSVETLKRDPYLLARDLRGVGFLTADTIATNIGLKPDAPQRLKAGIYYALERASEEGHCYLDQRTLIDRAQMLLRLEPTYDLSAPIDELIREEYLSRAPCGDVEHPVYINHLLRAEEAVADFAASRAGKRPAPIISPELVKRALAQAAAALNVTFSYEQEHAVQLATEYPLMIITGGPGCGKTTIIRALSVLFQLAGQRLLLAAPTGRAAQRMGQVCSMPACTIHRLLKYDPTRGTFVHGVNDPLSADAIIIDEASMIDVQLARDLFSAIPKSATLILVGDKDQLPSVGPGRVFGDLISVSDIKTISLSRLFRRSEESAISTMAHLINSGTVPDIPEPDGVTRTDAYFIPKPDPEEAAVTVEKLVSDQIPRKFGISPAEICVLTPSNRGPLGTLALNQRLQARINPPGALGDAEQELQLNDFTLRIGDRVCQRVNNYNIDMVGVFNGDVGQVFHVDRKARSLTVEMWDGRLVKYEEGDLSQLSLAYAVTVHRSQGSEIPCVVLVLHESHFTLLERQLVYTAVTRAKKLLIVVGSRKALNLGVKRMNSRRRCTLLRERTQARLDR